MLKLLKMATGMRALLDTVVQALPQVSGELPQERALQMPPRGQGCREGLNHWHSFICVVIWTCR